MDYTVYFADKAVVFTAKTPGEGWYAVTPAPDGGISRLSNSMPLEKNLHDPEMKNQVEDED
ncbi:hypothetical protein NE555_16315, partial [Alistipes onderdonkii]|nr:hypothetical protein [Alistipes onderdonkii]